jgi:NTE family protein
MSTARRQSGRAGPAAAGPRIALALGAGGARGLAHISALKALEEMGMRPALIIGASIGAIIGACAASGMGADAIADHASRIFKDRARVIALLLEARVGRIADLISGKLGNPVLVDGERILDLFWPREVPDRFEALALPFIAVATDYHLRSEVRLSSGPLTPAVAASMAIPGLVKPVMLDGAVLIDGGAANPLPYDDLPGEMDLVVACDVGGGVHVSERRAPEPIEAMIGASQILMSRLVARMVEARPPDILIRPAVDGFGGLDFFKAKDILAASEPAKEELKRKLELKLKAW